MKYIFNLFIIQVLKAISLYPELMWDTGFCDTYYERQWDIFYVWIIVNVGIH